MKGSMGGVGKYFPSLKIHTKEKNAKAKSYRNEPIVG